jgi:two-component system, LytTR family, response regulator
MKKAVIFEDSPMGVSNLVNLLAQNCQDVKVIASTGSVKEGLRLLEKPERQPDIAFLDIELEDGYAFEILDQLEEINFEVIFVTAHSSYTKQACEYGSIGYIEKPIDTDKLKAAVERVRPGKKYWTRKQVEVFESHFLQHPNPARQMIVQSTNGCRFFQISDIAYLRGEGNSTWFHFGKEEKFLVCRTLADYEMLLLPLHFYRIHKSYLVNVNEIERVTTRRGCFVHLRNGTKLPVAKRRRLFFFAYLKKCMERLGLNWGDLE